MKKRINLKSVLAISFLAIAGLFGVTSVVLNKQAEETPVVEKTKADSIVNYRTIYFATTTSRNNYYVDAKLNNAEGDGWRESFSFSQVGKCGSYYIYSASVGDAYGGLNGMWIRYGSGGTGGTWVATAIDYNVWTLNTVYANKVWYSSKWDTIYTITYNPNGASGSTKTDYKLPGVTYSILSYSSAGISSHSYKHAVKWSTNSAGTGTDYQPSASYKSDANLSLHFIEDWYTYQFKVNNGSWITMNRTPEGDTPPYYVVQYYSDSYSFTSGDTISFQRYYGTESATAISTTGWEGNITSSNVIKYSHDGKVYLKVTSGNAHTVYAEGDSERGVVVVRGGHEYKCACSKDSTTQWHASSITLLPGDTLKATYNGGDGYTVYVENYEGHDGSIYGITSAGVVSTPGVYTIYLKSYDEGHNFPNVWLNMEDSATADLIADTFSTALATVCASTVAGGATSQITSAFSTQRTYYNHLTSDCKDLVETGTSAKLNAMHAKYDYIVGKYGTTIAPDYLGRNPASFGSVKGFSPLSIFGDSEDNLSTIIIIVASSVALLSVTALSILVIKKRKHKEQ